MAKRVAMKGLVLSWQVELHYVAGAWKDQAWLP